MTDAKIACLPGDGIGPEIMEQAVRVLDTIAELFQHTFTYSNADAGGAAYLKHQCHLPEETLAVCRDADAVLFGAVGGPIENADEPQWRNAEKNTILALRKAFQFQINLRPTVVFPEAAILSPLKPSLLKNGIDLLVVRELVGDIYFGLHETITDGPERIARDIAEYTESQIIRTLETAFKAARNRKGKVTVVHKANVLDTSKLWKQIAAEMAPSWTDINIEEMLVDNCALQLMLNPAQFDVIVTGNLFGDILSDQASGIPGTLGLAPSASLSESGFGLYEPAGGSAPDIAGKGIANPVAQILSAAMMLTHSFELHTEAQAITDAVQRCFRNEIVTADMRAGRTLTPVTTEVMGTAIISELKKAHS